MKKAILLILIFFPLVIFGQSSEIGIGAGVSVNSAPMGNLIYKGLVATPNYAINLAALRNCAKNWQFGVDLHVLKLSRKLNANYPHYYSTTDTELLGGNGKKVVYGEFVPSVCLVLNKKLITKKGYFYVGALLGANVVFNFKKQDDDSHPPADKVYYQVPSGGYGIAGGMHAGYNRWINSRMALNAELAVIGYSEHFDKIAPQTAVEKIHYTITSYPLTIGIRYRFGQDPIVVKRNVDKPNRRLARRYEQRLADQKAELAQKEAAIQKAQEKQATQNDVALQKTPEVPAVQKEAVVQKVQEPQATKNDIAPQKAPEVPTVQKETAIQTAQEKPAAQKAPEVSTAQKEPPANSPVTKSDPPVTTTPQNPDVKRNVHKKANAYAILVEVTINEASARALKNKLVSLFAREVKLEAVGADFVVTIEGFKSFEDASIFLPKVVKAGFKDAVVIW